MSTVRPGSKFLTRHRMSPGSLITLAVSEPERSRFFPPDTLAELRSLGDLTLVDGLRRSEPERYKSALWDARVVVTAWNCPPLTAEVLDAAPNLELMAHAAGSVKRFVTEESWRRGIRVCQSGFAMAPAVAQLALTMTLVLLRRIHRFDHALRAGKSWDHAKEAPWGEELDGCPVGVVGASRVGRAYLTMIGSLGADVRVYDPYLTKADANALGVAAVPLAELMRTSRIVALHAPATPETHHLIGAEELALLPTGAGLVNTARSQLVDMRALYRQVADGRIDAALDVFDVEPLPEAAAWRTLPNVLLTPHVGGKTTQSRRRGGQIVVAEIDRLLRGEPLQHEVTEDMLATMG